MGSRRGRRIGFLKGFARFVKDEELHAAKRALPSFSDVDGAAGCAHQDARAVALDVFDIVAFVVAHAAKNKQRRLVQDFIHALLIIQEVLVVDVGLDQFIDQAPDLHGILQQIGNDDNG